MSAYIQKLRNSVEERVTTANKPITLRERLITSIAGLPAPTRNRPFSMQEFEAALGTTGRYISPILIQLGWQRKRLWNGREHYHRYWIINNDLDLRRVSCPTVSKQDGKVK